MTGSGGSIGNALLPVFAARYALRTFDLQASDFADHVVGSLDHLPTLRATMKDVEVVVHLAATAQEAPFVEELVPNNVVGMWNLHA